MQKSGGDEEPFETQVIHFLGSHPGGASLADLRKYFRGPRLTRATDTLRLLCDSGKCRREGTLYFLNN